MKILLDECVTKHLKPHLIGHQVSTVRELGWSDKYPITIVIFNSYTSKVEELLEFLPEFESQLPTYQKHNAYLIRR